ncbi:MAG TPA: HAMP domain-containing sensor histidine kinase [Candidatus Binatia bacterium]|nr:HAMP domain-containing sensor histidine kinase [Candidatus Binatia bacterium]
MAREPDDTRAATYEAERRAEWQQAAKLGCIVSLVFVPLFSVLGAVVGLTREPLFLEVRLLSMLATLIVLKLLSTDLGRRHPRALTLVQAANLGLLVDVVTVLTGGGTSPRYAGLTLLIFGGAALMPWRPLAAAAASGMLIAVYALLTAVTGHIGNPTAFRTQLVYLAFAAAVGIVSGAYRERLRRREFASRMALVDALQQQGDFTARWSHEIRTPINVMIGYADILLDDALERGGAEARRLVQRIRNNGVTLRNLISDLLDFSKAEAGRLTLHPEPVSLPEVVEEIGDTFRPVAERKGLDLEVVCPSGLPPIVTDRQRLSQILTNLVANAVKFTERGRVTIEVHGRGASPPGYRFTFLEPRGRRGASAAPDAPAKLAILVRDTGIGIREADIVRLAADYAQLDGKEYGGTGLGLSISRRLARLLGGRIGVASRRGEGTTFALFLPLATPAYRAAA